jgi:alginate O-acetyltransferase complex protein AlgI
MLRVGTGILKKFCADYLSQVIAFWQDRFAEASLAGRWVILLAIAARILFDFSGYSDMAIGFARMMGIRLPENFQWPYLARSPAEFWRRWHISLSSWIRDYLYIPMGGGRGGVARKLANGLICFALCGLWHGAAWNFVLWGIYHGVGVGASTAVERVADRWRFYERSRLLRAVLASLSWCTTLVFIMVGWLLFFYPIWTALDMMRLLVQSR